MPIQSQFSIDSGQKLVKVLFGQNIPSLSTWELLIASVGTTPLFPLQEVKHRNSAPEVVCTVKLKGWRRKKALQTLLTFFCG